MKSVKNFLAPRIITYYIKKKIRNILYLYLINKILINHPSFGIIRKFNSKFNFKKLNIFTNLGHREVHNKLRQCPVFEKLRTTVLVQVPFQTSSEFRRN